MILAAAASIPAAAQSYGSFSQWCQAGGQKVLTSGITSTTAVQASYPRCAITVYLTNTVVPATLYSDVGATLPISNPFCARSDGSFLFYTSTSVQYDVVMSNSLACNPSPAAQLPDLFTFPDISVSGSRSEER